MMNKSETYFCPTCGGSDVEVPALVGATASCRSCGWTGTAKDMAVYQFEHDLGSNEEVLRAFFHDVRTIFAKGAGVQVAALLVKWGFMDTADPKTLARYLSAGAKSFVQGLIDERRQLEKERTHGSA